MKRFLIYVFAIALVAFMTACGGSSGPGDGPRAVDPNAPIKKLDPTILQIEFD